MKTQAHAPEAASPSEQTRGDRKKESAKEPPSPWSELALDQFQRSGLDVQAKLSVSQPDDPLEREADRVAQRVMSMGQGDLEPEIDEMGLTGVMPKCEGGGCCSQCEEEVQRESAVSSSRSDSALGSADVSHSLESREGRGKPLGARTSRFFTPRFGRDFANVRIHDDPQAHHLSGAFNARAFTLSNDIYFAEGQYNPDTREGKRLLAHELTHVVQQSEGNEGVQRVLRQVAETLNYDWLADRVHTAVVDAGTDEEAIYRALEPLERDSEAIRRLREVYRRRHSESLDEALADDLSDEELEYARQLINAGDVDSDQRIAAMPVTRPEFDAAAERIHEAVGGAGTDEEAVYAVLTSFDRNLRGLRNLQAAYYRLFGAELRDDLSEDFSGSEWSYVEYLMGDVRLARTEEFFGQEWEVQHTDVTGGDVRTRLVGLYQVLTGLPSAQAEGAVAALDAAAGGRSEQLLFAFDFLRDNRHVLPPLDMAQLLRDTAQFVGASSSAGGPRFYSDLLQAILHTPSAGNFQIAHTSGDVFGVPGLVRGQTEFRATGRRSSLLRPGVPDESEIRGGFTTSLSIQQGFATYAHTVRDHRVEALIRSAEDRIDAGLRDAVRVVARDQYFFQLLESFLQRDSGRLIAMDNESGRYVNEERPPSVRVGTAGGILDTRATLVHEMLHYAFDKADTALGDAGSSGGADHPAIQALETRFVVVELIRNGIAPTLLPSRYNSTFGRFLSEPDLLPQINAAIRENRASDLLSIVNSTDFVVTTVSSGLLEEASGMELPDRSDYRYTPDQMQDLAAIYAQIAVIVRRAMREAVNVAGVLSVPLNEVFARREWIHTMSVFQRMFVGELQATPTQGIVALGDRIQLPAIPTSAQRSQVEEIFNPQQHAAARSGRPVPQVADPDTFVEELVERGRELRATEYARANRILSSSVQLDAGDLSSMADIGVSEVAGHYGRYMPPGVNLNAVRQRIRFIPPVNEEDRQAGDAVLSERQLATYGRSALRIKIEKDRAAQEIIQRHNVLIGGRDRQLYRRARNLIYNEDRDQWNRVALSFGGWNPNRSDEPALLQRNVTVRSGDTEQLARRRGRWVRLGTTMHETLHEATHRDFRDAMSRQEQPGIGHEGFTEFFSRERYQDLIDRTRPGGDDALRVNIEGAVGPPFTPPPRRSYTSYFNKVNILLRELGGNEENLRQAYFGGHVEYLGLGSRRHSGEQSPRQTPESLGIQRKAFQPSDRSPAEYPAPSAFAQLNGSGSPLAEKERSFFESRFDTDFARVRIHTGSLADRLSRDVNARAFTFGSNIAFRDGEYQPRTRSGKNLIAHELVHVEQQTSASEPSIQRKLEVGNPGAVAKHLPPPRDTKTSAELVESWVNALCPHGKWTVDPASGVVSARKRPDACKDDKALATSSRPVSCDCICWITGAADKTVTVLVAESFKYYQWRFDSSIDLYVVDTHTQTTAASGGGFTIFPEKGVWLDNTTIVISGKMKTIAGRGETGMATGATKISDPPWIILGHELCGHARLRGDPKDVEHVTTEAGDRSAVDIENRIRREHSTAAKSLGVRTGDTGALPGGMYVVQAGDTFESVSKKLGLSVDASIWDKDGYHKHILHWPSGDRIRSSDTTDLFKTGQELFIKDMHWHQVLTGETWNTVAKMWDKPVSSIKRANVGKRLSGGTMLLIPVDQALASNPGNSGTKGSVQKKADAGSSSHSGSEPLPAGIADLHGSGMPLASPERTFFESRFGADFSAVRVHDDARADRLARRISARAFTIGTDIAFRSGEYAPHHRAGKSLIAHELAHVVQQGGAGNRVVQRQDLEADFAGLESVPASNTRRPSRHISVETPSGRAYAPVRNYRPSEIPAQYRGLSIPSSEAETYRSAGIDPAIRGVPEGHVAIGHLARYEQRHARTGAELIVSIARVNGQFQLVGFDVSVRQGEELREGFVQGGPGVRGTGRVLLASRIQRGLSNDVSRMRVEMGFGAGTEAFHEEIFRTARIQGSPQDTPNYTLNVRHMIRLLVAWDETITDAQRSALRQLSEGRSEPTAGQARAILRTRGPGGGGGGTRGGGGGGGRTPPTPSSPATAGGASVRPGEYIIHNGRWYEVVSEPRPGQSTVNLRVSGQNIRAAPLRVSPVGGGGAGVGMIGLSIVGIIAAVVGPLIVTGGRIMANQRLSIERGRQELELWEVVGARPTSGLWDPENRRPAPEGAHARQAINFSEDEWFGHHYRPYVVDIDVAGLRSGFGAHIRTYQEFASFMEAAEALGAIDERDGSYYAVVNKVGRSHMRYHEITDIITATRSRVYEHAAASTRENLEAANASEESRSTVFRINRDANVFRSAHGSQPILNAWENFGPDPWVRVVDTVEGGVMNAFFHGHYVDRLRVVPVNADAYRGATYARYSVRGSIEEVWREVRDFGRPVYPAELPSGPLTSFTAGPHPTESRFGTTTYARDPNNPGGWTIATGELRTFWVDQDDIEAVSEQEISRCLERGRCGRR